MNKKYFGVLGLAVLLAVGYFTWTSYRAAPENNQEQNLGSAGPEVREGDHRDAEYLIEGSRVKLRDGLAQMEAAPGSASTITTRYFGNEFRTDLNGDGREDVVFLLTQNRGGSGTYFYAVAALNTADGYVGSDGYLLGDRISPQNTTLSPNAKHRNVIVVNYADRAVGEPMAAQPSVGKSAYLKLDPGTMRWGIVEPDFEGESR